MKITVIDPLPPLASHNTQITSQQTSWCKNRRQSVAKLKLRTYYSFSFRFSKSLMSFINKSILWLNKYFFKFILHPNRNKQKIICNFIMQLSYTSRFLFYIAILKLSHNLILCCCCFWMHRFLIELTNNENSSFLHSRSCEKLFISMSTS